MSEKIRKDHTDFSSSHPYEGTTYCNPLDYLTKHLHFDWTVDFDKNIIKGFIDITTQVTTKEQQVKFLKQIEAKTKIEEWAAATKDGKEDIAFIYKVIGNELKDEAMKNVLSLDTRDLDIDKIEIRDVNSKSVELKWKLHDAHFSYGSRLDIDMTTIFKIESVQQVSNVRSSIIKQISSVNPAFPVDKDFVIRIHYQTRPECGAAQWLPAEQTTGGKHPYVFTQCQSIYARCLFPCQDTPGIKTTYDSIVRVPKGLVGLMSAVQQGDIETESIDGKDYSVTKWHQKVPVPSYLIVIIAGNLDKRDLSERCRVWSEPEFVQQCADEFSDLDSYVTAAEKVCGSPYEWGRYDMVVLPKFFGNGGMENPSCTFVTPALIVGDKSLVDVCYHEIAHSWSGNLVTNQSWPALWLNEGFTMIFERKITKYLQGQKQFDLAELIGWEGLRATVQEQLSPTDPMTCLHPQLDHRDADDGFNLIPYEKAYFFLRHIEETVGGPTVFEPYLHAHIANFRPKSITEVDWVEFLFSYFGNPENKGCGPETVEKLKQIDWHVWLIDPGMPPVTPKFGMDLAQEADDLADAWLQADSTGSSPDSKFLKKDAYSHLSCLQQQRFLDKLLMNANGLSPKTVAEIDKAYDINNVKNAEIRYRWQVLAIRSGYTKEIESSLREFADYTGRINYLRPVFGELMKKPETQALAKDIYAKQRKFYQTGTASGLDAVIEGDDENKDDGEKVNQLDVMKKALAFDCKSRVLLWMMDQKK